MMYRLPTRPGALALFGAYMRLTGTPTLKPGTGPRGLSGKVLGLVNGSNWVSLWGTYFGRKYLPGVKLVHAGNDAVQLGFMAAHRAGRPCPPQPNIDCFVRQARDIVELHGADAILITCSTMNRAAGAVREALAPRRVPVVQIDEPMMEEAVARSGRILVIATHGPTVTSTQALLRETAARTANKIEVTGATVEEAFHLLGRGRIELHNRAIARVIRQAMRRAPVKTVVLAQLSMSVFNLTYPDPEAVFHVPVLTSGDCGFRRIRDMFLDAKSHTG